MLKIFTICCLIAFVSSCGKNEKVYRGITQGIYEGANQTQEMKKDDPTREPGKEPSSYDQYERERQEMIKNKK